MSAPECGAPTKQDGQPCRRRRYHPCQDHGSTHGPTESTGDAGQPLSPTELDRSHYHDPHWQRRTRNTLLHVLGRTDTRKLLGLNDCHDLAKVARFLDKAARLEPGPLLDQVEALCSPETAPFLRSAASKFVERLTGVDSLKKVARALRITGVWHCAVSGAVETCPCLDDLEREAKRAIRTDILSVAGHLTNPSDA